MKKTMGRFHNYTNGQNVKWPALTQIYKTMGRKTGC